MPARKKMPKKPRKDSYALQAPKPTEASVIHDARLMLEIKDIAARYDDARAVEEAIPPRAEARLCGRQT